MSLQRVRRAIQFLRKKASLDDQLSEIKLITDGQSIFRVAQDDGALMDALKEGQMAFFLTIDDCAQTVDSRTTQYLYDRDEFIAALRKMESTLERELPPSARRRVHATR